MESPSESQTPPAGPATHATGQRPRFSLGNIGKLFGIVIVLFVIGAWYLSDPAIVVMVALLAGIVLIPVIFLRVWGRVCRKRGWSATVGSIVIVALWLAGLGGLMVSAVSKVRDSSKLKAMMPRQMGAAVDQFYLENGYRIFVSYDELVGPERYVKAYNPKDGEDLGIQFPIRRDWSIPLPVRLPDGTTAQRYEVIAAVGRSGLITTYPQPQVEYQPGGYDPNRVYRLDCGISYRGYRVVDRPPDPAGREGRDQDGVHIYQRTDGSRFEITYRGGVPDGPFRAYWAEGRRWGEATYAKGRLTGPSWIYLQDGSRFDELDSTQRPETIAGAKLAARDFAGALKEFNRALELQPDEPVLLQGRAETLEAMGNLAGALIDLQQAQTAWKKWGMTGEVKRLDQEIARLRKLMDAQSHPAR